MSGRLDSTVIFFFKKKENKVETTNDTIAGGQTSYPFQVFRRVCQKGKALSLIPMLGLRRILLHAVVEQTVIGPIKRCSASSCVDRKATPFRYCPNVLGS